MNVAGNYFFYTAIFALLGALSNHILSFLSLVFGGGNRVTRTALGARALTEEEHDIIHSHLVALNAVYLGDDLRIHNDIYAIDSPMENAYTVGRYLYITSSAIRSPHLDVILAHELAHVNLGAGDTVLSLKRFVFPAVYPYVTSLSTVGAGMVRGGGLGYFDKPAPKKEAPDNTNQESEFVFGLVAKFIRLVFSFIFGGFGVKILAPLWASHLRQQDYLADSLVADFELEDQLIEYLKLNTVFDSPVPFMLNIRPYAVQRIDILENPEKLTEFQESKTFYTYIEAFVLSYLGDNSKQVWAEFKEALYTMCDDFKEEFMETINYRYALSWM